MEEMTNIIPSMRFDEFKYSWKVTTLGEITRQYRESNKNVHHQNLLSLSYGKIVRKDIESKKGLLPASFDTYQIIKKDIIVFRVTDLQNDKKSLRVGISEEEGIITPAYVCVECDTRVVDPHYLYMEKPRDFDPFGQTGFAHLWLQYDCPFKVLVLGVNFILPF